MKLWKWKFIRHSRCRAPARIQYIGQLFRFENFNVANGVISHHLYWLLLLRFRLFDWDLRRMFLLLHVELSADSTNYTNASQYEWVIVRMCGVFGGVNQTLLIVCWSVCLKLVVRPFNHNFSSSFRVEYGQLLTDKSINSKTMKIT